MIYGNNPQSLERLKDNIRREIRFISADKVDESLKISTFALQQLFISKARG